MPAEKITLITGGNKGLGYETRALIRDPERADGLPAGVDRAIGDLDHPGTLAPALKGVDRVFHMQASHGTEQTQAMVEAARQAGLRHIVALSSMGAAGPWPASANGRPTRSSASGHESWMSSKPGSDGLQANRGNPEPGRRFARPWGSIRRAARSLVAVGEVPPERTYSILIQLWVRGSDVLLNGTCGRDEVVILPVDRPVDRLPGELLQSRHQPRRSLSPEFRRDGLRGLSGPCQPAAA